MNDVSKTVGWVSKEISYRSNPIKFTAELTKIWPHVYKEHLISETLLSMLAEGEARLCITTGRGNEEHSVSTMHSLIFDTGVMSTQEAVDLILFMSPDASEIARESDTHISFNYDPCRSNYESYPLISIYEYLDDDPYQPLDID